MRVINFYFIIFFLFLGCDNLDNSNEKKRKKKLYEGLICVIVSSNLVQTKEEVGLASTFCLVNSLSESN